MVQTLLFMQGDIQVPVAHIPCINDVDGSQVQFVDGHNGWGLTALHIAVFQGSVNTGRVREFAGKFRASPAG